MDLKVKAVTMYTRPKFERVEVTKENFSSLTTNRSYFEQYGNGRPRMLPRKQTPSGKSQIGVSVEGESLWDDFENRTSRPHTLWAPVIKAKLIELGWPADVKLRWSQKAGCSCPCSPAFFITGGPIGIDFTVTIMADEVQADADEKAHRHAALVNDPTIPVTA